MGKIFLFTYFIIQDGECKGHIFADGTIQVFANTSGHKFTLDDAKIVVMEGNFFPRKTRVASRLTTVIWSSCSLATTILIQYLIWSPLTFFL